MHDGSCVRVGIGLSPDLLALERPRLVEIVARINESAINHVVVTDHVAFRGGRGRDGLASLHYLAGLGVERELHTGVLILPLRHPTLVARQLLDLADAHPPGVVAGVGLGGDDPDEYAMVGMNTRQRGRRMDDAVALLVELLRLHDPVSDGGHYPTDGPGLERGAGSTVPVLVGGRVDRAHERAAGADGWLGTFCSPSRFGAGADRVRRLAADATLGYQAWVGIGSDGRAQADAQIERFYGLEPAPFEKYVPVGGPEAIAAHLSPYVDAGATVLNLFPAGDPETGIDALSAVAGALER